MMRSLRFAVRRWIGWRRGPPVLVDEPKDDLFADLGASAGAAGAAAERLLRAYDLGALAACSTRRRMRENLALVDVLDRLVGERALGDEIDEVRAVDVGARDWTYAFGLERFLRWHRRRTPRRVWLRGVEVDGHCLRPDRFARCDFAAAHAGQTGNPGVDYVVGDFRDQPACGLDVVTMLCPFVSRPALRRWGLPDGLFDPEGLFRHAVACLRPGGWLIVVHHTAAEAAIGRRLVDGVGLELVASAPGCSALCPDRDRTGDRVAVLARRPAQPE